MNSSIQMQAVVEAPYYKDEFLCPWAVQKFKPFSMIRLWGEMTNPEIGLIFAQLAKYNGIEITNDKQAVLEQIIEAENLILPGGIQTVSEDQVIPPSCCCGLETWREWRDFLKTGDSPWLGHDPSPWLESKDDVILIWSDGGMMPVKNAFHIDASQSDFEQALKLVEQDLQEFLFSIESWARDISFARAKELFHKFDECFNVRKQYA